MRRGWYFYSTISNLTSIIFKEQESMQPSSYVDLVMVTGFGFHAAVLQNYCLSFLKQLTMVNKIFCEFSSNSKATYVRHVWLLRNEEKRASRNKSLISFFFCCSESSATKCSVYEIQSPNKHKIIKKTHILKQCESAWRNRSKSER